MGFGIRLQMSASPVLDLVKGFFPSATDQQAESILWTCTGWPGFFVVPEGKTKWDVLKEQLEEIAVKSGGVVERALVIAD